MSVYITYGIVNHVKTGYLSPLKYNEFGPNPARPGEAISITLSISNA